MPYRAGVMRSGVAEDNFILPRRFRAQGMMFQKVQKLISRSEKATVLARFSACPGMSGRISNTSLDHTAWGTA